MTTIEGRVVGTGRSVRLSIAEGRISNITDGSSTCWIGPGFVDLQLSGYAGTDINDDGLSTDAVLRLVAAEWERGVTTICPTVVTASEEHIVHALRTIADARRSDPLAAHSIACIHVEGPTFRRKMGREVPTTWLMSVCPISGNFSGGRT